jgi:hypothetical protein
MYLSGGLFDNAPLSAKNTAAITNWNQGRQLVAVLSPGDVPVMMGFVGPGHSVINTRTTADALTYFAIAGYLAPTENQEVLFESLESQNSGTAVVAALNADLAANPAGLTSANATFRAQLKIRTQAELGLLSGKRAPKVSINPAQTPKSGVTVDYGSDTHQIVASNTFHRRALMFVDRISDVDSTGAVTKDFARVNTIEVQPAAGTVYGTDTYGNLGNLPVTTNTAPATMPDVQTAYERNIYTVAVAGPGVSAGDAYTLSSTEQADLQKLLKKSFFEDFLIPTLSRALLSNTLDQVGLASKRLLFEELTEEASAQQDAVAAFVDKYFPQAESQVQNGDFQGALQSTIGGIWGNSAATNAVAQFYTTFLQSLPDFPGKPDVSRFGRVLSWVNKAVSMNSASSVVYSAIDNLPQGRDWSQAAKMQTWEVDVDREKITFTPMNSTINSSGTNTLATLTTSVTNTPKGASLVYKYTTPGAHGSLGLTGGGGQTSIQTAQNKIYYSSNVGLAATFGIDPITVQVFIDHGSGNLEQIGAAKAFVKVEASSDINLIPNLQSVHPGSTAQAIVAKTHYPSLLSDGTLQLKWSLTKGLGTLNVGAAATSQDSVSFTAGQSEGTETVNCATVETATGKTLSTATATIKIERKTSIVMGALGASGKITENDANGCTGGGGVFVTIPVVSGAKSYSVYCYNFDDPSYWGTTFSASCDANGVGADFDIASDGTTLTTHGGQGKFFFGLTGGAFFGPGPCASGTDPLAESQATAQSRFGGMIVQCTVTY